METQIAWVDYSDNRIAGAIKTRFGSFDTSRLWTAAGAEEGSFQACPSVVQIQRGKWEVHRNRKNQINQISQINQINQINQMS